MGCANYVTSRVVALRLFLAACAAAAAIGARGDVLARSDQLFDDGVLHRIDLLVAGDGWATLEANFRDNDYYPATFRWNGLEAPDVGIRSRGGGSRSGTKPGLRVDFGRFTPNQTFLGLRSIVLDNLAQDASGVRERVAMRFYERLGLATPREAHAQLYVNGEPRGLYVVVESIDEDFVSRAFGRPGYLFEYEYDTEWFLTRPAGGIEDYRELFDPVTRRRSTEQTLFEPFDGLLFAINEAPGDHFASSVGRFLDLPLFMRHVAAQNFAAQNDGILGYAGVNNFYFYRPDDPSRSQFVFWDEDNAFLTPDFPVLQGHERNVLMRRAMAVPELRAVYLDTLLRAAGAADGWLEEEVRRQIALAGGALRADTRKPFTNQEVEAAERALLEFARSRSAIVRREVAKLN